MPQYEYVCKDCNEHFSLFLALSEHEKDTITCPKCSGHHVEQQFSTFYAVTSRKAA
jgi:putative FmdB family regulatory protein